MPSGSARQLHLFRGKRQRGSTPPAPLEFASQAFLVDIIRRWIDPRWRFTHIPLGEYRDPATAGRLQRLGVVGGWPDLQFAGPDRQMAFLELKRRGSGRLSDAQEAMRDHLVACGFDYLCTDSVDQAVAWLKAHGILRGGFAVQ
jgi:hypothetical protein